MNIQIHFENFKHGLHGIIYLLPAALISDDVATTPPAMLHCTLRTSQNFMLL
jgi:hypothetical protein